MDGPTVWIRSAVSTPEIMSGSWTLYSPWFYLHSSSSSICFRGSRPDNFTVLYGYMLRLLSFWCLFDQQHSRCSGRSNPKSDSDSRGSNKLLSFYRIIPTYQYPRSVNSRINRAGSIHRYQQARNPQPLPWPLRVCQFPMPEKESSISDSIVSLNNGSLRPVPSSTRSQIIIGSQTLIPGASPVIISGVTVSLPSSGDNVVIGQNTLTLPESHHNASNTSSVGSGTTNNVTIPSPTRSLHTDTTLPGPATASSSQTGHGKRLDLGAWRSITTSRLAGFATVALI